MLNIEKTLKDCPEVEEASRDVESIWINEKLLPFDKCKEALGLTSQDIDDAEARLQRFAPLIMKCFPETEITNGIIESPTRPTPKMKEVLNSEYCAGIEGSLLLKMDSHLAIAGSVKARGGIYEVLKHTEDLALDAGLIKIGDDYSVLASEENRRFFEQYKVQVASTGNLGMSIGIMSAAIGYTAIVHMSADAKQWKKDLLRSRGVTVIEYETDYNEAVNKGRASSDLDPMSYFVDDENSKNLFLGYAVAARRLKGQLSELGITVDSEHPLFVYIPCGVGGAPGGITFGLKEEYGDNVHCFFAEPTEACCMMIGMATGLHDGICVRDIGLSGITDADGLAVGRPSKFVGKVMTPLLSGIATVKDARLYDFMRKLNDSEDIFIEPSSCAAYILPASLGSSNKIESYVDGKGLSEKMKNATHIVWATGGSKVPDDVREAYKNTYLD